MNCISGKVASFELSW